MTSPRTRRAAFAAAGAALLALAACAERETGICPRVAVLGEAARLTKFRPGAPETPENVLFTGEMGKVEITCKYADAALSRFEADVTVTMTLTRGPAMSGNTAEFPYFVSVVDRRGIVIAKREFPVRVNFGSAQAVQHTESSWQFYPRLRTGGAAVLLETWVGFQLTDAELAYNRRRAGQ